MKLVTILVACEAIWWNYELLELSLGLQWPLLDLKANEADEASKTICDEPSWLSKVESEFFNGSSTTEVAVDVDLIEEFKSEVQSKDLTHLDA